jgi:hypothetical protein
MCRVNRNATHRAAGFAAGALTFAAAHAVEVLEWAAWFGNAYEPWFLNSGRAVAFTMACLFVASLLSGWLRLSGLMIAAGAATAMTVVLFLKEGGPGTIFPIVIAAGTVFILAVSVLGAWIGGEISRVAGRARGHS